MKNFVMAQVRKLGRLASSKGLRPSLDAEIFGSVTCDPARLAQDLAQPCPETLYVIYFTPRSGSSWLTDVLAKTGVLGNPVEWFNPGLMPRMAQGLNADNLKDYVALARRRTVQRGGFAFEITMGHISRVFGSDAAYLAEFPASLPAFYLRREDMVLQAVSLAKAVHTQVYHSAHASAEDLKRSEAGFEYDGKEILRWLEHIRGQEEGLEAFFARHGIAPHRLSYEGITAAGAEATAQLFLDRTGRTPRRKLNLESGHTKIGTDKNQAFADRFRAEYPAAVAEVERFRAGLPRH